MNAASIMHDREQALEISPRSQTLASLFTPTWMLGLLLFGCLFLPSFRGCNGQAVHIHRLLAPERLTAGEVYLRFVITWPFFFGLILALGTLTLAWSRRLERARLLWWGYALLVMVHAVLLGVATVLALMDGDQGQAWTWEKVRVTGAWHGAAVVLLALIPITCFFSRGWFHAAMAMQLALALTAACCLSFVTPALMLANRFLVGGKLAVACSVSLIVLTIVQRLDGRRALTRRRGDSWLQLSLKSTLLLMGVSGIACAWVATYLLLDVR